MCVDYIDLNKYCLKDLYLFPDLDKLVGRSFGYQYLSFMDAYSGYNQILLHLERQIGQNLEVYVDDMIVKSNTPEQHIVDLAETFAQLQKYNMRLNTKKYVFGVSVGKFLGYMSERVIELNPDKCWTILEIQSPNVVK